MRLIGLAERTLEKMCRRVRSRVAFGKPVSEQTVTQERIAEARIMPLGDDAPSSAVLEKLSSWSSQSIRTSKMRLTIFGLYFHFLQGTMALTTNMPTAPKDDAVGRE